ncbi:MAG: cyclase family protein [Chloroflexi bacterium]|nr:cyclase family protein [Chloroflexota bacterium]MBI3762869.1 cyclase family protein [Chloroflexota bacterium]
MTIYDISLTITPSTPVWPDNPAIEIVREMDMARGDAATVSRMNMGVHTATHLDAPIHFVPGGTAVETLDLNVLVGPARVAEALRADVIDAALLESLMIPAGTTRLLVHTRNSDLWAKGETRFREDFVAVNASGAKWLVDHGIKLIGVDYLSVAPFGDGFAPHDILLRAGIIPVEGLNLTGIGAGEYQLVCLPIKLGGSDGAPCRAILIR